MKTISLKVLLLIAIVITMMSCGGSQNRNRDNKNDNTMSADSLNRSGTLTDDDASMGGTSAQETDMDFLTEAASGSLMEVELARYAQQNAQNARVKNFAAMMVRDHSKVNEELKSIASRKNIIVPSTMEDNHREMMSDIQKKTGADFDREYMKVMVDDHEKDVDKFKRFAEEDNVDADLKTFASKTLPILLMHQDSAKQIRDDLK